MKTADGPGVLTRCRGHAEHEPNGTKESTGFIDGAVHLDPCGRNCDRIRFLAELDVERLDSSVCRDACSQVGTRCLIHSIPVPLDPLMGESALLGHESANAGDGGRYYARG